MLVLTCERGSIRRSYGRLSAAFDLSGDRVERMTSHDTVVAYASAWAEPDHARRLAILERCWAAGGVYLDPSSRADGREALCEHIAGFQERLAGHRIELASGIDEHDGYLRFAWTMSAPDGSQVMEGVDFGQLDADGRLKLICGFFGPWPELSRA
jgi:SnoaL-like protein